MPNTPKGLTYPSNSSPVAVPADIQELAEDVDGLIVPNTGGTYTGSVSFTNSPSVPTPTSALHAVNKTYADAINTDVTALETELGTNPSGTFSTVVQRLDSYTDGFNKVGNLLTANQASVETDASDWQTDVTNCVVTKTAEAAGAPGQDGSYALKFACTGAGTASVQLPYGAITGIVPGETYTASASFYSYPTTRTATLYLQWFDSGNAYLPPSLAATVATSTDNYKTAVVTAVAPAGAVRANLALAINSPGTESHYVDKIGLWRGASGRWSLPGTPVVGQSRIAVNNAVDLSGTGVPEWSVSAAPGSTWLQTDSTTDVKGWIRWIKATGTGNTGWVAGPEADTGLRSLTLANDWTGTLTMQRIGRTVYLYGKGLSKTSATSDAVYSLLAGFRSEPQVDIVTTTGIDSGTDGAVGVYIASSTAIGIRRSTLSGNARFTMIWTTNDPWPSSLPGSAA